jgi:hypothetical protein
MPRPYCTVCEHRERAAIDVAIARGISLAALAKRYRLGKDSLWRHKTRHQPAQLKARLLAGPDLAGIDLDKLRETESQSLLSHLIAIRHRCPARLCPQRGHLRMRQCGAVVSRRGHHGRRNRCGCRVGRKSSKLLCCCTVAGSGWYASVRVW